MRRYHDVLPLSRDVAVAEFESGDAERICHALVAVAFHEPDWRWAQDRCLELLDDRDPNVSGLAATCLGHVARIHGTLDKERVVSALRNKMDNQQIVGIVEDAL